MGNDAEKPFRSRLLNAPWPWGLRVLSIDHFSSLSHRSASIYSKNYIKKIRNRGHCGELNQCGRYWIFGPLFLFLLIQLTHTMCFTFHTSLMEPSVTSIPFEPIILSFCIFFPSYADEEQAVFILEDHFIWFLSFRFFHFWLHFSSFVFRDFLKYQEPCGMISSVHATGVATGVAYGKLLVTTTRVRLSHWWWYFGQIDLLRNYIKI